MNDVAGSSVMEFRPALRKDVALIIAVAGASGAGKTYSGLLIARGLCGATDRSTPEELKAIDAMIAGIDTEAGRMLHYAVTPGELPSHANGKTSARFGFRHLDLKPPFSPERYMEAIDKANAAGFKAILVDSCSHEWEGEGGLHDAHNASLADAVERARKYHKAAWGDFDEERAADKANIGAWREPKERHKRFVNGLLQSRAHLVLCLRADEKLRIETVDEERNGRTYKKTVITQAKDLPPEDRWTPICEKRFMYEMTLSLVVTPQRPGYPVPIKLQGQHSGAVPLDRRVSVQTGFQLGRWSAGDTIEGMDPDERELRLAAGNGKDSLRAAWRLLTSDLRERFTPLLNAELLPAAERADQAAADTDIPFDDDQASQAQPEASAASGSAEGRQAAPGDASGGTTGAPTTTGAADNPPTSASDYVVFVRSWSRTSTDAKAINLRYEQEKRLRDQLKVDPDTRDACRAIVDARIQELGG